MLLLPLVRLSNDHSYALSARDMRTSNLTVESARFDAILDEKLDHMMIWWLQDFCG
jgi:hypothetical protein